MAIEFVDTDGTLIIPSAVAKWETAPSNSGISTRGVVLLVGEADQGPSYAEEPDNLAAAAFGPGQFSAVQAKYGSGPLVDAFRVAANPSRDPSVRGSPTQIICVKTNQGTKAQLALAGGYGVLQAKASGALGNLIYVQVTAAAAEVPAALTFGFVHLSGSETVKVAANGGTAVTLDATGANPAAFVSANTAALAAQNVTLTGGVDYQPASGLVSVTANVTVAGAVLTIALVGGTWATQPSVGDVLAIANTSSITGAANANSGTYVVSSSTPSGLVATKYADASGGAPTTPVAVSGATANAGMLDGYTPVTFTCSVASSAGLGKSLTWYRDPASVASHFFQGATQVSASKFASSATEASVNVLVNRRATNTSETFKVGGNVAFSVGHVGATAAPVTLDATNINLNGTVMPKVGFKTLGDLAAWVNAQPNWFAQVPAAYQSLSPSVLDLGTFPANQNGVTGTAPARIKRDAYDVQKAIAGSSVVQFSVAPTAGVPAVQATAFLSGGAKGGTSDAAVASALLAAGLTRCNFVVTLFSRDASADVADGLTDASSTYTVDGVNANAAAHVAQFSQFKKRRPRQAFVAKRDTFASVKTAARSIGSFRVFMSFLDVSTLGASGLQWFQPWMGSALAAGMQAAGFYRPIFNKQVACFGARQAAGDFSTQDDDAVEDALTSGLGVIRDLEQGGFGFTSDQTTYGADDNFVLNSVQATYASDVIAQTVAQRFQAAYVGQSFADVTAAQALSFLKGVMADLMRLKLIASSDDAVDGYKDAKVQIKAPAMQVSAEVKVATGVYFVPIKFLVTEVVQTASQG